MEINKPEDDQTDVLYYQHLQMVLPEEYYSRIELTQFLPNYDWPFVLQINYKTFETVRCLICLREDRDIVAPHMTCCTHIYCLPCALLCLTFGRTRSRDRKCALCKEKIAKEELKLTNIVVQKLPVAGDDITFSLCHFDSHLRRVEVRMEDRDAPIRPFAVMDKSSLSKVVAEYCAQIEQMIRECAEEASRYSMTAEEAKQFLQDKVDSYPTIDEIDCHYFNEERRFREEHSLAKYVVQSHTVERVFLPVSLQL